MRQSLALTALGIALNTFIATSAAIASYRTPEDICFQWAISPSSADENQGDVYFQLDAPPGYQWLALGTNHRMKGSNMFIIYNDGKGNVTVAEKDSNGHTNPIPVNRHDLEVISGSQGGVNKRLTGNIRCRNCTTPRGRSKWIAAWREGAPLNSIDPNEHLVVHDDKIVFEVDLSQAILDATANDHNPFDMPDGLDQTVNHGVKAIEDQVMMIHAVLMSLAFLLAYPIGSILMPILGNWKLHSIWQTVTFLVMWVGFALGYVGAQKNSEYFTEAHTGLGTLIVVFLSAQPFLGYFHHLHYRRHQSRGAISHTHIWYGRVLILAGIINGGLGLQLVGEATTGGFFTGYIVLACVAVLIYAGGLAYSRLRKSRARKDAPRTDELQSR